MLRRQLPAYSPVAWRAVVAATRAAAWGDRGGSARRRLVEVLKARYGATDVLLTDSGTSALRLALAGAARAHPGGPVALPGYGCYDVATAAVGAGAPVALYDLDPATLGPDAASLASLRPLDPAAIVIAHLYGQPVGVEALRAGLGPVLVIEDAAQGFGGTLDGRPLGSFGSLAVLSFGRGKGVSGGGGGALLAHDEQGRRIVHWARTCCDGRTTRGARQAAVLAAQLVLGRPALFGIPSALPFLHLGETLYRAPRAPRAAASASVVALERTIELADREATIRRANAARWLRDLPVTERVHRVAAGSGARPGYLRLPLRVSRELLETSTGAASRRGVARGYPATLAQLPQLVDRLVGPPRLSGATALSQTLLTLPTHSRVTEADFVAIASWLAGSS
jgi:dTDP-4-amino-4,6-dideoxygalactose transaminase